MKPSLPRRSLVLLAAAAAVPLLAMTPGARAQFQIDNSRANDANNRIGSGGYNTGSIPAPEQVNGNLIVTGNVTGAKAFRGPVGYSAPNEFFGPSATKDYDRFIRDSSAPQVSYNHVPIDFANTAVPYYSSVADPPQGFVRTPSNAGFIPAAPTQYRSTRFDDRLGVMTNAPGDVFLPAPGQLLLPGPVDAASNQQTYISASPLTGIRQISLSDPAALGMMNAGNRSGLSDEQILRMRRELSQTLNTPDLGAPSLPTDQTGQQQDQQGNAPAGRPQPLTAPPPRSFEAPENQSLSPKPLGQTYASTANDLSTGQGSQNRMLVPPPTQQSSQYAEMRRRLDRYNTEQRPKSAEQLNQEFQAQRRAVEKQQQANAAKQPTPSTPNKLDVPLLGQKAQEIVKGTEKGQPQSIVHSPTGGVTAAVPSNPQNQPVEVRSLATGVAAPGLRSLLQKAETDMASGKFDTAIAQYESAAQVAPNNPMILLGQANAELGGEYFARAENHLRQSFLLDPTLLMARYDLRGMLGERRLDEVIDSLKKIASKEANQYSPAFLLSYIAYNSHDPQRAASYLDLAEKRAGGPDPVFRLLRTHWNLPTTRPAAAAPSK
jgi:tetratricopeptide (TPR) repeat protein